MKPSQLFSILFGRWRMAVTVLLLGLLGTVAAAFLVPRGYTATATVVLDVRSPDQVVNGGFTGMLDHGYRATQVNMVMSERVAEGAIGILKLDEDDGLRELWRNAHGGQGDFMAWLAQGLLDKLSVEPHGGSNIMTVSYSDDDALFAAEVVNAFIGSYIDTAQALRLEPVRRYDAFYEQRTKELLGALQAAQTRLSTYQQDRGLLAVDERLDLENSRIVNDLSSHLVQLQARKAELAERQQQGRRQPQHLQEVLEDPVVVELNTDLAREASHLKELSLRIGESHPLLLEQSSRVAELKARLSAAIARAAGSTSLNRRVADAQVDEASLAIQAQRSQVLRFKSLREAAAILQGDVENAQTAYDGMVLRANQSRIESQNTLTNVAVLKHASEPLAPSSPNLRRIAGAGVVLSCLLALGAVAAAEALDRRLRTAEDVLALNSTLLLSIPAWSPRLSRKQASAARLSAQRLLTGTDRRPKTT